MSEMMTPIKCQYAIERKAILRLKTRTALGGPKPENNPNSPKKEDMSKIVQKALKAVAKREGISVESVRREIENAVAAARKNNDPGVRALWEAVPVKDSEHLTGEDIVAFFVKLETDSVD
jgi:hypothetical protein